MKAFLLTLFCLSNIHASDRWIPHTFAGKEGDNPNYGSEARPLNKLLFNLPPTLAMQWPKDTAVTSANCKLLGYYKGHQVIQANLSLSDSYYTDLLLILCSHSDGYKVVASFLDTKSVQYHEVLSAREVEGKFVIMTKITIPGTNPHSSEKPLYLAKEGGELSIPR